MRDMTRGALRGHLYHVPVGRFQPILPALLRPQNNDALAGPAFIGIVGEYLAKTYLEVKHRPIYIVAETEESKF